MLVKENTEIKAQLALDSAVNRKKNFTYMMTVFSVSIGHTV